MRAPENRRTVVFTLLLATALGACSSTDDGDHHDPSQHEVREQMEDPHADVDVRVVAVREDPHAREQAHTPPPEKTDVVGHLRMTPPDEWIAEAPANNMRKAQFILPAPDGHAADDNASLVVFHFAGGGGGVQANFDRWAGQFTQPDGGSSSEAAETTEWEVNGMTVHVMYIGGRYVAETRPGSGERVDRPDFRMLAAIIESNHGAYFVKAVGPAATIAKHQDAFEAYVDSAMHGFRE